MMKSSAVSSSTKRSALTQEAIRRLRNTHEDVPKEEVAEIFNKFAVKMKNSGYSTKFRREIINAGFTSFKRQRTLDEKGEKMMFRSRNFEKAARKRAKLNNRDWWKRTRAGVESPISVIKVHWTPESKLLKKYQEVCRKNGVKIKFVEQSGHSLQNLLEKGNPFGDGNCEREDCFPCQSCGGRGKCEKAGAGYVIVCCNPECREQGVSYQGETGRNSFSRGLEHRRGLENKKADSALWKHCQNAHNGDVEQEFEMQILKTYGSDNTTRMVNEAMRIREHLLKLLISLNSRAEYRQPRVPRVVIEDSVNSM